MLCLDLTIIYNFNGEILINKFVSPIAYMIAVCLNYK